MQMFYEFIKVLSQYFAYLRSVLIGTLFSFSFSFSFQVLRHINNCYDLLLWSTGSFKIVYNIVRLWIYANFALYSVCPHLAVGLTLASDDSLCMLNFLLTTSSCMVQIPFSPDKRDSVLYSDKFPRTKFKPTLSLFGSKPMEGWVAVTATGLVSQLQRLHSVMSSFIFSDQHLFLRYIIITAARTTII